MLKCVILQPSYIPWRGYFHQIQKADVFVFYDDVQYDKHGWRNRNRVKSAQGIQWLTIPVHTKGSVTNKIPINRIMIDSSQSWNVGHWSTLKQLYNKAPYFRHYAPMLESFYSSPPQLLADFTIDLTIALARQLGIAHTKYIRSSSLEVSGSKTDRLIAILQAVGATHYISGPSAKDYLEEDKLAEAAISLEYMIYDYPEYSQFYPPFVSHISILDLLFMTGPNAADYIWGSVSASGNSHN